MIGRYVQNKEYTTISREGKVMPVLEVMYIGDADGIEVYDYVRK